MNILTHQCKIYIKAFAALFMVSAFTLLSISSAKAGFWSNNELHLLPEDDAFSVSASFTESGLLSVNWSIADGYYMYRDQFAIEPKISAISNLVYPKGVIENDPEFGEVEVYFYNASLNAELLVDQSKATPKSIELVLKGQGCNKPVGVCYPPLVRTIRLDVPENLASSLSENPSNNSASTSVTKQRNITANSSHVSATTGRVKKSFFSYVISAFFAGILLSFTPCVLPMIPILAGVIAGQTNSSKMQSGWLAICYVGGTIVTYLAAGWLAGATGAQLQAYFQNIWVISFICLLLLLLAASLFGWYKIQLPSALQSKLSTTEFNTRSASISSFILGLVSALVVGACVSPVLILALGAAITQGDPILGASIMGAMAMGMGLLLIFFGFGAGWILPKSGAWMNQVQVLFGFMVLGVAIYLIGSVSLFSILYLWAALLLCAGFYVWQLAKQAEQNNNEQNSLLVSVIKAAATALILWGAMALIGGTISKSENNDILHPLQSLSLAQQTSTNPAINQQQKLPFVRTTKLSEVQTLLESAKQQGKPVLIDFYADWCLDCKRMQRTTFKRPSVNKALENWSLIEIDVTDTSKDSEQAKRFFNVFGPPATLFYNASGTENTDLRHYGYLKEAAFLTLVNQNH